MTPNQSIQCYQCGTRVTLAELVRNHEDCPECGAAHTLKDVAKAIDIIASAKSAPAEPVSREAIAWRVTGRSGLTLSVQFPRWAEGDNALLIEPLYTAPPSPDAELVALLRDAAFAIGSMLTNGEWYSPEELKHRIDAKLASLK